MTYDQIMKLIHENKLDADINAAREKAIELAFTPVRKKLEEYSNDKKLIDVLDSLLMYFTIIENAYELIVYPMECIIQVPSITVEMCQLIDEIRTKEWESISKWIQWLEKNSDNTCPQS